jgi:hypothetical protein
MPCVPGHAQEPAPRLTGIEAGRRRDSPGRPPGNRDDQTPSADASPPSPPITWPLHLSPQRETEGPTRRDGTRLQVPGQTSERECRRGRRPTDVARDLYKPWTPSRLPLRSDRPLIEVRLGGEKSR